MPVPSLCSGFYNNLVSYSQGMSISPLVGTLALNRNECSYPRRAFWSVRRSVKGRKDVRKGGGVSAEEVGHGTDNFPCSGNLEVSPGGKKPTGHIREGEGRRERHNVQEQKIGRKGWALTWNTKDEPRNAQEDVCYTSETCRVLALHAFFLFVA